MQDIAVLPTATPPFLHSTAVLVMVTLSHENSEMTFRVLCKKAKKPVIHHSKLSNQKW